MKKKATISKLFSLFITFLKIGLFTFGGGYAMIPIIQKETVEKKKWVNSSDILDIIAVSEATPGPIAIGASTYIGFNVAGIWGSFFATLGICTPSFVIIYLISLIYDTFMSWSFMVKIFKGLKVGVIILLFLAVKKLAKGVDKNKISFIIFSVVLIALLLTSFFLIDIPFFTLILMGLGIVVGIIFCSGKKGDKTK